MTRRVSYQSMLAPALSGPPDEFAPLPESAIATRRKDARTDVTVALSRDQARWLDDVCAVSGPGVDQGAVLRALVDLGRELDVDWPLVATGKSLRAAVRQSVKVRRGASE